MKKLTARAALALSLVAASLAVLAPPLEAHACGGYDDSPEVRVRRAALHEARAGRGDAPTVIIHSVRLEGSNARVVVRYEPSGGGRATVQALDLREDANGAWRVTGRSYVLDARSVGLFDKA